MWPRSPVWNQPCAVAFAVASGIVVIAGEHARAAHADLAGGAGNDRLTGIVQDRDIHAGARKTTASDWHLGIDLAVQGRRQDGDVAGHLAEAEILHQHLAQLAQGMDLVGAIHRRAGIDDVAQ